MMILKHRKQQISASGSGGITVITVDTTSRLKLLDLFLIEGLIDVVLSLQAQTCDGE